MKVHKGLLYLGVLALLCPYVMLFATEPYVFRKNEAHPQTTAISGVLHQESFARRGGVTTLTGLKTKDGLVVLNCAAPAYLECFPDVSNHVGAMVRATVIPFGEGAVTLRRVEDENGKVLASEEFFDARIKSMKASAWSLVAYSKGFGMLLIGAAIFVGRRNKTKK